MWRAFGTLGAWINSKRGALCGVPRPLFEPGRFLALRIFWWVAPTPPGVNAPAPRARAVESSRRKGGGGRGAHGGPGAGRGHVGGAVREVDGAGRRLGGRRRVVRGGRGRPRRAAREGRPRQGRGGALPGVRGALRGVRRARAHVAPPGHLAVQDLRALRRAARGLPRARRGDGAHALGGQAELALHGAVRGAGPGGRAARRDRPGGRRARRRVRPPCGRWPAGRSPRRGRAPTARPSGASA